MIFTDPSGNDCVYVNSSNDGISSIDNQANTKGCGNSGGYWVDGTVTGARFAHGGLALTGTTIGQDRTSASYALGPDPGLQAVQRGVLMAEPGVNLAAAGTAAVMGGAFAGVAYGAIVGGEVGTLGLELLSSQARNIQAIENAIANHVQMRDLMGAAKETAGFTIRTGNKVWNHHQELIETARNLRGAVRTLENSLKAPGHDGTTPQLVEQAIQKGQTALRQIDAALRR